MKIGFIGQGFVGKNYADVFESKGFEVVRYSKEELYEFNEPEIKNCEIVFIAVPTPTTPKGFDDSVLRSVIPLCGKNKIVVIKSTIFPGLTRVLQDMHPDKIILHSPEFLSEVTAKSDAQNPFMNIVGMPYKTARHTKASKLVLSVLPKAPFEKIVSSDEAEIIKYSHNCSGFTQIIFFNLMYDLAKNLNADWKNIEQALKADPYIPNRYASPVHKKGRGAGGNCFIKDMRALSLSYKKNVNDKKGFDVLESMQNKNKDLLISSNKDISILKSVYGKIKNK